MPGTLNLVAGNTANGQKLHTPALALSTVCTISLSMGSKPGTFASLRATTARPCCPLLAAPAAAAPGPAMLPAPIGTSRLAKTVTACSRAKDRCLPSFVVNSQECSSRWMASRMDTCLTEINRPMSDSAGAVFLQATTSKQRVVSSLQGGAGVAMFSCVWTRVSTTPCAAMFRVLSQR